MRKFFVFLLFVTFLFTPVFILKAQITVDTDETLKMFLNQLRSELAEKNIDDDWEIRARKTKSTIQLVLMNKSNRGEIAVEIADIISGGFSFRKKIRNIRRYR